MQARDIGDGLGSAVGGPKLSALAEPASIAPEPRTRRISSPGTVLAVAALGTFMAFVDATIVNIAIPNIHQEFAGSSLESVSWVLNAYNIVFAAFLVGGGQLADLLGRRRIFCAALILFTLASAACAAAPTLGLLVAARLVQAAGAAALVPELAGDRPGGASGRQAHPRRVAVGGDRRPRGRDRDRRSAGS